MLWYILKRLAYMIPVLLCVAVIVFSFMFITPGDPAVSILGDGATPEAVASLREEMGLNDTYLVQLGRYLKNLIFNGDMGNSYITGQPIIEEILLRYPATLKLAVLCLFFGLIVGIGMGVLSAIKQYSILDNLCVGISLLGLSAPVFWTSLLLILIFSVHLGWLPSSGSYGPLYWIMPVATLSAQTGAYIMRITRSSMLEVIRQDYIRTARSKGQSQFVVVMRHALRNAMIPIVTIAGNQICVLLAGATIAETIFALPGLGKYLVDSMNQKNYVAVQGVVLWIGINCVIVNLIVDIIYAFIDPKVRATYQGKGISLLKRLSRRKKVSSNVR